MKILDTGIDGCWLLEPEIKTDLRGAFIKNFRKDWFLDLGLETNYLEEFYSISNKNVLRGMHFQTPPHHHAKLVSCIYGSVYDVIYDLREGSSSYKKSASFELSDHNSHILYVAPGVAHGFFTQSDKAIMTYKTSTYYSIENDKGFLWNSANINWPESHPIISDRDSKFPTVEKLGSFNW